MLYRLKVSIRDGVLLLVKRWLLKGLIQLSRIYPPLVEENIWHPNARILFGIFKRFEENQKNEHRKALFEAVFRIGIGEYQQHIFYRTPADWLVREIKESDWLPMPSVERKYWRDVGEKREGVLFPTRKLEEIMGACGERRAMLIQDLIISAGDGRQYKI